MIKRAAFIFQIILVFLHFSALAQQKKIDSLRIVFRSAKNDTDKLNTLNRIAKIYGRMDQTDSAIFYSDLVIKRSDEILKTLPATATATKKNLLLNRARAAQGKGYVYANQGNYPEALKNFQLSANINKELGDMKMVSYMYNNIALVYQQQGNYPEALNTHLSSLKIKEQLNDKLGIAGSYSNIGIIYGLMLKYPEALKNFTEANKIFTEANDKSGIAETIEDIGNIKVYTGDTVGGMQDFQKALILFKEIDNPQNIGRTLVLIADIDLARKRFDEGLKNVYEALKLFEMIGDQQNIALAHNDLGTALGQLKRSDEAIGHFQTALKIANEIGSKEDLKAAYEGLSNVYNSTKDYKRSLEFYKLFTNLKDTLLNEDKNREIGKLEAKGEFDKQQAIGDAIHKNEIEKRDAIAAADNKRKNTIIFSVAAGLALVAVFAFFIFNRFRVTQRQKQIIEVKNKETEEQKSIIEEKQKEIIDSINYAKRIQFTLLAHQELLKENLKNHFVLFMPKDIVSGDFYWATKKEDRFYLAVCDSTGHGVPGAFMSLLNITFLNEAVIEKNIKEPNLVLEHVRKRLIENMEGGQDGMDAILICLDTKNNTYTFSAANNSPLIIKNGIPLSLNADKMPVGKGISSEPFTLFTIDLKEGDLVYLYTDGYADQFGGPKGKKFKYKQLEEKLSLVCEMPFEEQRRIMQHTILDWKGDFEQVDDICLIGLKI